MQVRVLYICFNEVSHQLLSWLLLAMFSSQLLAVTKAALYLQHKQQARQPERGPPSGRGGEGMTTQKVAQVELKDRRTPSKKLHV